jgi:hypothetical protein
MFDTHIIANSISEASIDMITNMGFKEQKVVGGDPRVRMERLWSNKTNDLKEADLWFKKLQFHIKQDNEFVGYVEEEVITFDEVIDNLPLNESAWDNLLPALSPSPCPENIYKECDVHLSLHDVDPAIDLKLKQAGFYHLDLDKPSVGHTRIYTMQAESKADGKKVLDTLINIVKQAGGIQGFLKFEITRNIYNQGFLLPPILLKC